MCSFALGELRTAEWAEFDADVAIWTIPAGQTKMRRPHKVPLSMQVLALLEELRPMSGEGQFLFFKCSISIQNDYR
jgi:integrase